MHDDNIETQFIDENEAERIEKYIADVYSAKVPPPSKPTKRDLSFWNLVGIKATFFSFSALGAVVFSAIRTGGYFYIVENALLSKFGMPIEVIWILSMAAFITALLAFEGYAVADGFSKGESKTDVSSSKFGIVVSFSVIMIVGVFSGFGIIELSQDLENIFNIIAALFTSVGAAFISFFGGENIGYSVSEFRRRKQEIMDSHTEKYSDWREGAIRSYSAVWRRFKNSINENIVKNNEESNGKVQEETNNEKDFQLWFGGLSKYQQVKYLVEDFFNNNKRLPTTGEISTLGYSVGYAARAINEFIVENEDSLRELGISEQKITKAKNFFDKNEE